MKKEYLEDQLSSLELEKYEEDSEECMADISTLLMAQSSTTYQSQQLPTHNQTQQSNQMVFELEIKG